MKIQVKDLMDNMSGIYKITFPNNKIYIGMSNDIRRRMWEHNNPSTNKTPCDLAINKYGKIEEIEILDFCNSENRMQMGEREKYWIAFYHSNDKEKGYNLTPGGDNSTLSGSDFNQAVFTNEQVLDIRKRRFFGERKVDVYKDYNNISFNTFENVWLGNGYKEIGQEFIIPKGAKTRQEYSSIANSGERNNKAKLTKEKVLAIRKRFDDGEQWKQIAKDYQEVSKETIRKVCYRYTWKNI